MSRVAVFAAVLAGCSTTYVLPGETVYVTPDASGDAVAIDSPPETEPDAMVDSPVIDTDTQPDSMTEAAVDSLIDTADSSDIAMDGGPTPDAAVEAARCLAHAPRLQWLGDRCHDRGTSTSPAFDCSWHVTPDGFYRCTPIIEGSVPAFRTSACDLLSGLLYEMTVPVTGVAFRSVDVWGGVAGYSAVKVTSISTPSVCYNEGCKMFSSCPWGDKSSGLVLTVTEDFTAKCVQE